MFSQRRDPDGIAPQLALGIEQLHQHAGLRPETGHMGLPEKPRGIRVNEILEVGTVPILQPGLGKAETTARMPFVPHGQRGGANPCLGPQIIRLRGLSAEPAHFPAARIPAIDAVGHQRNGHAGEIRKLKRVSCLGAFL